MNSRDMESGYSENPTDDDKEETDNKPSLKLWIQIEESNNPNEDEHKLREIVRLLLNHKGDSPAALLIRTNGKVIRGELPFANIKYCEQLHSELVAIVGDDGINVETLYV